MLYFGLERMHLHDTQHRPIGLGKECCSGHHMEYNLCERLLFHHGAFDEQYASAGCRPIIDIITVDNDGGRWCYVSYGFYHTVIEMKILSPVVLISSSASQFLSLSLGRIYMNLP